MEGGEGKGIRRILELLPPLTGWERPRKSGNNEVRTVGRFERVERLEELEELTTNILADSYRPSGGGPHQQMVFMQAVNTRERECSTRRTHRVHQRSASTWLASILARSEGCCLPGCGRNGLSLRNWSCDNLAAISRQNTTENSWLTKAVTINNTKSQT